MRSAPDPQARPTSVEPLNESAPAERPPDTGRGVGALTAGAQAAERLLPNWEPSATVQVRSIVPLRAPIISRLPPPPDPAFATHELLNLPFEAPGRYVHMSPDGETGAEIGRGGIGRVLLTLDQHLGREVALKELLPGSGCDLTGGGGLTRFLSEARITGQLEHPNIVPVYELGRRTDGRLYYAMRVVRGETLGEVLARASTCKQRMALLPHLSRVCNAIAYAHSRGVIHRDIKPDNIMIGEFGETIVLDWGIAKLRGETNGGHARIPRGVSALEITSEHGLVGTPLFMSPEQLGGGGEVNEQSDVWALGVVLYSILCGRPPFSAGSLPELKEQVLGARPTPVRQLVRGIPPELAAIARRALQRKQRERYPSAQELAADLDAYVAGQKVSAHTYGPLDLVRRVARRHRAASWVALVACLALFSLGLLFQSRVLRARDRAVAAEQVAVERATVARRHLAEFFSERSQSAWKSGDYAGAELNAAWSLSQSESPSARGLIVAMSNQPTWEPALNQVFEQPSPPLATRSLKLEPDGRVEVTDLVSGQTYVRQVGSVQVTAAVISAQGAVALGDRTGHLTVWWPGHEQLVELAGHRGTVLALAFSSDGRWLASAGAERSLIVWDVQKRRRLFAPITDLGHISALMFSPDNKLLAAAAGQQIAMLSTPDGDGLAWFRTPMTVIEEVWFRDRHTLVAKADSGEVHAWKRRIASSTESASQVLSHRGNVLSQVYISESTLVTAGLKADGVCIWDILTGECRTRLPVQEGQVRALAFTKNGNVLGVGMSTGSVYLWDASTWLPLRVLSAGESAVRGLTFAGSGATFLTAGAHGEIAAWSLSRERQLWSARASGGVFDAALEARSGNWWLTTRGGRIEVWDASGHRIKHYDAHEGWAMGISLHDSTQRAASIGADGVLALRGVLTNDRKNVDTGHVGRGLSIAQSPDGRWIATSAEDGTVLLWQAEPLTLVAQLPHHRGAVRSVRFSPHGKWLSSAGDDGTVRVWDLARLTTDASTLLHEIQQRTLTTLSGTQVTLRSQLAAAP